jgi:hypothetical protein
MHERRNDEWIKEVIELAAERAAQKAVEAIYAEIGRSGLRKFLLLAGSAVAAFLSWLGISGHWPK